MINYFWLFTLHSFNLKIYIYIYVHCTCVYVYYVCIYICMNVDMYVNISGYSDTLLVYVVAQVLCSNPRTFNIK